VRRLSSAVVFGGTGQAGVIFAEPEILLFNAAWMAAPLLLGALVVGPHARRPTRAGRRARVRLAVVPTVAERQCEMLPPARLFPFIFRWFARVVGG
jgi:hypothetical protein